MGRGPVTGGAAPPAGVPVFETRIRVRSYELDSFRHVNHAVYLNYFEQARFEALEAGGFPLGEIYRRGWGVHVVRVEVDYRREARLGEEIRIATWIEGMRNTSMTIRQRATRNGDPGEVVAEARVVAVWVDRDGKPTRLPREVRRALLGEGGPGPGTGPGRASGKGEEEPR